MNTSRKEISDQEALRVTGGFHHCKITYVLQAECQNTTCHYGGTFKDNVPRFAGSFAKCPKCGFYSFRVSSCRMKELG